MNNSLVRTIAMLILTKFHPFLNKKTGNDDNLLSIESVYKYSSNFYLFITDKTWQKLGCLQSLLLTFSGTCFSPLSLVIGGPGLTAPGPLGADVAVEFSISMPNKEN